MVDIELNWAWRDGRRGWALLEVLAFPPAMIRITAHGGPDNEATGTFVLLRPTIGEALDHCARLFVKELFRHRPKPIRIRCHYPNPDL